MSDNLTPRERAEQIVNQLYVQLAQRRKSLLIADITTALQAQSNADEERHREKQSSLRTLLAEQEKRADELQATLTSVEHEVALVYTHITNGTISKCNTEAATVIAVADDTATAERDAEKRLALIREGERWYGNHRPNDRPLAQKDKQK